MVLSPLKNSDTSTIYLHYKEDCFFYKMVYDGIPLNVYLISMSCLFLNPHNLTIFFLQFLLLSSQACGIISWLWNFVCFLYLKLFSSHCTSQKLNVFIGFPRERTNKMVIYLPTYLYLYQSIYLSMERENERQGGIDRYLSICLLLKVQTSREFPLWLSGTWT